MVKQEMLARALDTEEPVVLQKKAKWEGTVGLML